MLVDINRNITILANIYRRPGNEAVVIANRNENEVLINIILYEPQSLQCLFVFLILLLRSGDWRRKVPRGRECNYNVTAEATSFAHTRQI